MASLRGRVRAMCPTFTFPTRRPQNAQQDSRRLPTKHSDMRNFRRCLIAVSLALALVPAAAATAASDPELCRFADDRITESSGASTGSVSDGWFFTHNDSGDEARFFVVDRLCRTLATHTLPGVDSDDWEDMARGPDENGASSLWLGDIGDNYMMRSEIVVYRVPEPKVNPRRTGVEVTTPAAAAFRLRYEDVAHDAEALLVHPVTGRLYVVTKTYWGEAHVYAAPSTLRTDAVNVLTRVADMAFPATGTSGGESIGPAAPQMATTGADFSPAGDKLVIRTYTDAYEWAVADGDVAGAVAPTNRPVRTALPSTTQGEAVTYSRDGASLLVTTEGRNAPVHVVPSALR